MTFLNIAHRGASGYAPENTRAAFDLAIEMGADMIETDVQLTRDGQPVLIHDGVVDRVSNGFGPIGDYTLAELEALDFGAWYDSRFAGQRIVTLAVFIADYLPRIPAALEIKDARAAVPLVEAIRAAGIEERVHVTSFMWPALLDAKGSHDGLVYGFLGPRLNRDIIGRSVARGFTQICPHVDSLTKELVDEAHGAGLTVRAWGLSDRGQIERLRASGADGVTSNWPDWLNET
ncbi:MAG TPA: glycerophosphodiester phosphodiesterase family protein [Thermomicrobiales bacterium]|nr:glycerophosphodiester phosphodiesterase family protein [Thermomicrobiales bacterium]